MKKLFKSERGVVVIEATYTIFFAIVILVFFFSYGFLLYQRTMVGIAANQIAEEVSQSFKYRTATDGKAISQDMIENIGRYRYLINEGDFESRNEGKGLTLATARIQSSSLALGNSGVSVEIDTVKGDIGRRHYVIRVKKNNTFLFNNFLKKVFATGGNSKDFNNIEAQAVVESMDAAHYINNVKFTKWMAEKITSPFGMVTSIANVVNRIKGLIG